MISEWECFARARQGDESAWRELVDRHQARLMSLVFLITGSRSAAEDIVQETFMRVIGAKISHSNGTVHGLMGTIAYRLAIKELRQAQRQKKLGRSAPVDNNHNTLDNMLLDERDRQIAGVIRGLDSKHRDVLVLRFYADQSYEKIAELLEISIGTVKSRMFYAARTCREILKDKGILK